MTGTKEYNVRGAKLTATVNIYRDNIAVNLCLDLSPLDTNESDHSAHQLIGYIAPMLGEQWATRESYWWSHIYRTVSCKSGSQAHRTIKSAIARLDDKISAALIARTARKSEMTIALP